MTDVDFAAMARVSAAFRPATAIDSQDLFAGRTSQMQRLLDVVMQPGQHALVYGIRGVGKTSLARVMVRILGGIEPVSPLLYTCNSADTFDSIWRSILEDIQLTRSLAGPGFVSQESHDTISALDAIERIVTSPDGTVRALSPDDVRRALVQMDNISRVIVIDEFDRVTDADVRRMFADTVKAFSDQGLSTTLILIGVADSVDQLIEQHPSVQRCLAQIYMQPMSRKELGEIIDKGMAIAQLEVEAEFRDGVVRLAHGLPNYVHLIGQNAARAAVTAHRSTVLGADLATSISMSLSNVDESISSAYHRATTSNRETLYRDVLLACALAQRDERDTFAAVDVREQLATVTRKFRDIPAFAQHLKDFSGTGDRGGVLDRLGAERRFRYRFCDPLLPPYVLMRGHLDHDKGGTSPLPLWIQVSPSEMQQPV